MVEQSFNKGIRGVQKLRIIENEQNSAYNLILYSFSHSRCHTFQYRPISCCVVNELLLMLLMGTQLQAGSAKIGSVPTGTEHRDVLPLLCLHFGDYCPRIDVTSLHGRALHQKLHRLLLNRSSHDHRPTPGGLEHRLTPHKHPLVDSDFRPICYSHTNCRGQFWPHLLDKERDSFVCACAQT